MCTLYCNYLNCKTIALSFSTTQDYAMISGTQYSRPNARFGYCQNVQATKVLNNERGYNNTFIQRVGNVA